MSNFIKIFIILRSKRFRLKNDKSIDLFYICLKNDFTKENLFLGCKKGIM